jgi:poly(3-hydroxybutyrate) depolymerase
MKTLRCVGPVFLVLALLPLEARAQALTSLSSLRVGYNTRKASTTLDGPLKAQIDEVDRQLAEATRLGKTGEVRRLIAKGQSILSGQPWTDVLDFSNSVVLRTDQVIADSSKPHVARLEQIYSPTIALERSLSARVTLRERAQAPQGRGARGAAPAAGAGRGRGRGQAPPPAAVVKDLGTFEGVSRDLRESPYLLELDLSSVPDGTYQLTAEILDGTRSLGTTTLALNLKKGLDELAARLEADAKRVPEDLRASIRFPVDRMRQVNRGKVEMRTFNPDTDFASALDVASAARGGKNPFQTRTGDFKRHYLLASANEIMPYRVFVPKSYSTGRSWPLIVALHGLGGTEDSFFGYGGELPRLAEQHGYVLAMPLGYRVDGSYGWGLGNPPADPVTRTTQERSEQDVMQVLQLMKQHYKIDENRIYLMGHSMGGIGTWKLGPKYPDIWAALAPIAGSGNAATLDRIKHIPQIVVHGDDDRTVNVRGSRTMVEGMKKLGIEHRYIEVPGGGHSDVVAPNMAAIVEFFNTHKRGARASQ